MTDLSSTLSSTLSLLAATVCIVASSAAAANDDGVAVGAIDPDAAVVRALERSDVVKAAQLAAQVVHVDETATRLESLELQLGHRSLTSAVSSVDPFDDSQIGLSWRLPGLADFGLRQAAGQQLAAAEWRDVEVERSDLALEVRELHAQVLSLRAQQALSTQRLGLFELVAKAQGDLVRERLGTPLDAGLTSLDILDARAELADQQGELSRAEQRLASLLGMPLPLMLAPPSKPLCTSPGDDDDALRSLLGAGRSRSARLNAIDARLQAVGLKSTGHWLRFVPWINSVQVGYLPQADTAGEVRARVDVTLPFFEPLSPELRVLALQTERLQALRRAALSELEHKVRTARDRLQSYVELVDVYQTATASIDLSQELVERSLAADVVDVLRVTTVQERVLRARRQGLRAHLQCDVAAIELLRVTDMVAAPSTPPWAAP